MADMDFSLRDRGLGGCALAHIFKFTNIGFPKDQWFKAVGRGAKLTQKRKDKAKAPTAPPSRRYYADAQNFSRSRLRAGLLAYFFGRTESFIAFPTRNFSVVFAGI